MPVDHDRSVRLRGAVQAHYQASAPAHAIEADLAVLGALVPRRAKKRTLFTAIGLGSLVVLPFIGCTQSGTYEGGGWPLVIGVFLGIAICVAAFVLRGIPIVLRDDKMQTLRALLRRIDFAAGEPVRVTANFAVKPRLVKQDYQPATMSRNAAYVKVFEDAWLTLDGRLSNGIAAQLSHSTMFGREEGAHSRFDTPTTTTETVILLYPPQMNPGLASYGQAIAQHLAMPGAKLESVNNEPGSLSVRISFEGPEQNRPEPLAAVLAQSVGLVDRSRAYVQVDRDAWPAHSPNEAEIAAVRILGRRGFDHRCHRGRPRGPALDRAPHRLDVARAARRQRPSRWQRRPEVGRHRRPHRSLDVAALNHDARRGRSAMAHLTATPGRERHLGHLERETSFWEVG